MPVADGVLERRPDEVAEDHKEPRVLQGATSTQGWWPCEKAQRRRTTRICRGPTGVHPVGALVPGGGSFEAKSCTDVGNAKKGDEDGLYAVEET